MSAKWIWYSGDYEIYHSMLLHSRREEFDYGYPPMWYVGRPEAFASFSKTVTVTKPTTAVVHAKGTGYVRLNDVKSTSCRLNVPYTFPVGTYDVTVGVTNLEAFPAIYIDSDEIQTDETWIGHFAGGHKKPVGTAEGFDTPDADLSVFPFAYKALEPVSVKTVNGGTLYDFGTESFGPVTMTASASMGRISVYYGESEAEALDMEYAYLRQHLEPFSGVRRLKERAFRYIYIRTEEGGDTPEIRAELQYLPLEDIASFECDDDKLPPILDICKRAFHLNSREFFLDGIKRDRWVWAGDAYQSYMVNRYLFNDAAITKRTIRALLGKLPYIQHINTINDYSAYMFLGAWDYYFASGDIKFIADIWENLTALYEFIVSRLDPETGYVVQRDGDWIFIDWADIDKDGPLAAEQILLHEVYGAMERLSAALRANGYEAEDRDYAGLRTALKARIMKDFWRDEKSGFIDTYASGREHLTRHANIFAILYDFVPQETMEAITQKVLLNDAVDAITTPYFKLFELMAFAKMGRMEVIQDYIDSYWGGMVENGATSAWEEFDPKKSGLEHYAMYGDKFGCSLCHAWGAGPIYLLGRFCAGVHETSLGSETFEIVPVPGRYARFNAVVPMGKGLVNVNYKDGHVTVSATVSGGVLKFNGKEVPVPTGEEVTL